MKGNAVILGSGMDGLGTALALRRSGWQVSLFQVGHDPSHDAGLVLTSASMAILHHYGLAARVAQQGQALHKVTYRQPSGRSLISLPIAPQRTHPPVAIRASQLKSVLMEATPGPIQSLGVPDKIHAHAEGVDVVFENGQSCSAQLLVGADGLNSSVRQALFGPEQLRYSGYVCWHGFSPRPELLTAGQFFESSGNGHRFGAMAVDPENIYWYACINLPAETDFGRRTREELVLRFTRFHAPVAALIESTPQQLIYCQPCYEREPLKQWSNQRVTLVGEAAHPLTPVLGQTTCEALEDGRVLAQWLADAPNLESALNNYDTQRVPRSAKVQRASHRAGKFSQLENSLVCSLRDLAMRYTNHLPLQRHYHQLFGLAKDRNA